MIYFIQDTASGNIKIGFAEDPWKRLSKIQSDCPAVVNLLATEPGGVEREAALHNTFREFRLRGEWFAGASAVISYATALGKPIRPQTNSKSRAFWGGLSDAELEPHVGCSRPFLCQIRAGNRRPSPELAMELQRATGKSAIDLVFGDMAAEALSAHGVSPLRAVA